jgi:hypothetical protein
MPAFGSICRKTRFFAVAMAILVGVCLAAVPTTAPAAVITFFVTESDNNWSGTVDVVNVDSLISNVSNISLMTATNGTNSVSFVPVDFDFSSSYWWWSSSIDQELFWTAANINPNSKWVDLLGVSPIALSVNTTSGFSSYVSPVFGHESSGGRLFLEGPGGGGQAIPEPSSLVLAALLLEATAWLLLAASENGVNSSLARPVYTAGI